MQVDHSDAIKQLAQIFGGGKITVQTIKLSQTLLTRYGNLKSCLKVSLSQLQPLSDFRLQHWHNLLGYQQQQLAPLRQKLRAKPLQANAPEVTSYCHSLFQYVAHGGLRAIFLDQQHYYLDDLFIVIGGKNINYDLYIRDFYLIALRLNAYGVILAISQAQQTAIESYFYEQHHQLNYDLKLIDIDLVGVIDIDQQKVYF